MSETAQQEQGAAPAKPRTRKDWELFWRIIAVLMLLVIAWAGWVSYQIMPRSVVTPLAYSKQVRPIGRQPSVTVADPAPADVPAAASAGGVEKTKVEGLKFATEISSPPAEGAEMDGKPAGAPAVPAATGKRP